MSPYHLTMEKPDVLKTSEVAAMWGVDRRTVVNRILAGKLPAFKTLGGYYRIYRKDAEALRGQV